VVIDPLHRAPLDVFDLPVRGDRDTSVGFLPGQLERILRQSHRQPCRQCRCLAAPLPAGVGLVIDHQDAARFYGARRQHGSGSLAAWRSAGASPPIAQPHGEPAASRQPRALRLHRAAVQLHEPAHDGQANPEPAIGLIAMDRRW
jgi:hypothetical protein